MTFNNIFFFPIKYLAYQSYIHFFIHQFTTIMMNEWLIIEVTCFYYTENIFSFFEKIDFLYFENLNNIYLINFKEQMAQKFFAFSCVLICLVTSSSPLIYLALSFPRSSCPKQNLRLLKTLKTMSQNRLNPFLELLLVMIVPSQAHQTIHSKEKK